MTEIVVETRALTKRFGRKTALNDFTMSISSGGIHAIVGSNGAGKSTLFRLLLGIQTPSAGSCGLLGEASEQLTPETRGKIGFVNEEHTLPNWMTVAGVTGMQRALYPQWDQTIFDQVINHFDIDPKQKVSGLSRGERAGFNLSLTLSQKPELMILDEPTLGMDVVAKKAFMESLILCGTEGDVTILYCSHHMDEIERVADSLIIMEQGKLINQSNPHDFLERITAWIISGSFDVGELPGLLQSKIIEGQYHVTVVDQDESFAQTMTHRGAQSVRQIPVNLEHAVNAFLAKNHRGGHAHQGGAA